MNLSSRLFEAYIEHRVEPLVGTIEPSMYIGDFDWNDCPKPTGNGCAFFNLSQAFLNLQVT